MAIHFLISHRAYLRGLYYRACDPDIIRATRGRNKKQGSFLRKDVDCGNCERTDIFKQALKGE